jgi:SAM-dependent methyltransferase
MFFGDAPAAFANIGRALRPGGRLVLLTWQPLERNEWIRSFRLALAAGRELPMPPPGTPGPFGLSEPDHVRGLLASAGFTDVRLDDVREQMYFGPDPDDASRFIAGQFEGWLGDLDGENVARALDALRADMAAHRTARGVLYDSAAWLVTARR